ncbi:MAG: ABC transporter ATP-binding protein [Betaproteobacteria bacterium]|nr:MAG: ABC transporter ATP-binding protein [Betaproteobacteria bacterium]
MLDVRQVSAGYDGLQILWEVAIHVDAGEIVALMGPNGSGKSTLMNSVSGLIRIWSGEILFEGRRIDALPPHAMIGMGVAHVLERHRLFPDMTVLENLMLGCGPHARKQSIAQGLEQAYALFPLLKERRTQIAGSLSGGEQQMCAIARGLMSSPRLLLIDEPFIGLSPHMRSAVAKAIRAINRDGVSVLLIEQNVAEALSLSQRAYILREGRIVLGGRSEDLKVGQTVERIFMAREDVPSGLDIVSS